MNRKKLGISLIVLIITIIVIIILASAIILNLSQNNPINTARVARIVQTKDSVQDSVTMYLTAKTASTLNTGSINDLITTIVDKDAKININSSDMYKIDSDKAKSNLDVDLSRATSNANSNWYVDSNSGKVYLVYNSPDDYDSWLGSYDQDTGALDDKTLSQFIISKNMTSDGNVVSVNGLKFNKPKISLLPEATTKAIKWDSSLKETEMAISQANTDTSWYDYSAKKWANIITNNNGNKAYWVWIPRYAYKITYPHSSTTQTVDIKFLMGTTNKLADGSDLPSGYIVHPAFTFGDKELTGIWVAKFEASSSDPNKVTDDGLFAGYKTGGGNDTSLQVRVLPDVYSWSAITEGNVQTVIMNMQNSNGSVGINANVDTHQIKNTEWGAVAYLSQSVYGQEPWTNVYCELEDLGDYNFTMGFKTGYSGSSKDDVADYMGNMNAHLYNTSIGQNASTTGNIYGVFDMSGGSNEMTAAFIDNGSTYISEYGNKDHFENGKLKSEYQKYYDVYDPGPDAREGATYYGVSGMSLWDIENVNVTLNINRKSVTDATYSSASNKHGDAIYETSGGTGFLGICTKDGKYYEWLNDISGKNPYTSHDSWNKDEMLIGNSFIPWFVRGGNTTRGQSAGIFSVDGGTNGGEVPATTFRPVLLVSNGL